MGFINDDRVITFEESIILCFCQQHPISHHLDQGRGLAQILEPDLKAHLVTNADTELFSQTVSDGASGDAPGLGVADQSEYTPACFQANLG